MTVQYEDVCQEAPVAELIGQQVEVAFSCRPAGTIDKSEWTSIMVRTTIAISVETEEVLSDRSKSGFAIRDCLEIINKIISAYQATTRQIKNAGYILPLGTSDMQLFATIRVNGKEFRDCWPGHSIFTAPLSIGDAEKVDRYLTGQDALPLVRVFLTNGMLSLERGQYPAAVLQAATAVELRVTQVISSKLKTAGSSEADIRKYEDKPLGPKLDHSPPDQRALATYYHDVSGFDSAFEKVRDVLKPLRNHVAHRGHLASSREAGTAVEIATTFLGIVV
ncbi:MAG: hypothetical protein O7H41_15970 [Planctomycetota bacterium]|nr:hypothetical protein [Planctomycetota bacterium]